MSVCAKRLQRELIDLEKNGLPEGIVSCRPKDKSFLQLWTAKISGPNQTPYEGGVFELELSFGDNYPITPPMVFFKTRIYHPNISSEGYICVSILKPDGWSPAHTVSSVVLSIRSLLDDPDPDAALVMSIGEQYINQRERFRFKAKAWTERYARK